MCAMASMNPLNWTGGKKQRDEKPSITQKQREVLHLNLPEKWHSWRSQRREWRLESKHKTRLVPSGRLENVFLYRSDFSLGPQALWKDEHSDHQGGEFFRCLEVFFIYFFFLMTKSRGFVTAKREEHQQLLGKYFLQPHIWSFGVKIKHNIKISVVSSDLTLKT